MPDPLPSPDELLPPGTLVTLGASSGQVVLIPQEAETQPAPGGSEELKLGNLLPILRRRQRLLVAVFAATVAIGAAATLFQRVVSPVYQGDFRLLVSDPIDASSTEGAADSSLRALALQPQDRANTPVLIEVLTSPLLLEPIAQRLNVSPDKIASGLKIVSGGDASGVMDVSLLWDDRREGQQILEAISAEYLAFSMRQRQERLAQGLEFLDTQAPVLQQGVVELQQQLSSFRRQNSFLDPSSQGEAIQTQRQALNVRLDDLRQTEAKLLGMASAVGSGMLTGPQVQGSAGDPGSGSQDKPAQGTMTTTTSSLLGDLTDLEKQLAEAEASFSPTSPQVRSLRSRVNQLRPLLQRRKLDSIKATLAENRSEQAEVNRQALQLSRQFATNPNLVKQYEAIEQRLEIARANLSTYIKTREDFRLEVAQRTRPWRIISPPEFEDTPDKPNLRNSLMLSILIGGVAGVGAALLRDRLDHVFHQPQDVEDGLGLPLLGRLPFLPVQDGLSITEVVEGMEPEARFGLRESLRNLFSSFRLLRADKVVRLFSVTSTVELEGKSTASALFAQTMADLGQRVLLVDADLRRPSLHRLMSVANGEGLSNLLTEPTLQPERLIQPISERLDLITAGPAPPDATKLLSSERCSALVEQIRSLPGYDVVLFDTPPSLALSDALLLSEHLDGTVFLVSLQQVDRDLPAQALRRIRSFGVDILGLITNQVTKSSGSDIYAYGYGYSPIPAGAATTIKATSKRAEWKGANRLMRWLNDRG
ncbi:MAG: chain-length determining protein [Cyanobium sp.]|nr:MAG: chain-length determining protein [Cyanobium sp.]